MHSAHLSGEEDSGRLADGFSKVDIQDDSLRSKPIREDDFSEDEKAMVGFLQMKQGLSRSRAAALAIRRMAVDEGYVPETSEV